MVLKNKIKKELRKYNKDLDKFFKDIDIDFEKIIEISNEDNQQVDFNLLSSAIIDLRTEISGLKRKLVNDIEFNVERKINENFLNFQNNFLKIFKENNDNLKRFFNEKVLDLEENYSMLEKNIYNKIDMIYNQLEEIKNMIYENSKISEDVNNNVLKFSSLFENTKENINVLLSEFKVNLDKDTKRINSFTENLVKNLDIINKNVKTLDYKVESNLNILNTELRNAIYLIEDKLEENPINNNSKKKYSTKSIKLEKINQRENKIVDIEARLKRLNSLVNN